MIEFSDNKKAIDETVNFIVYDDNGNILRTGTCKESVLPMQGDNVIKGVANDRLHKVVNGDVVSITPSTVDTELRELRNAMLKDTDWTQMPDAPLSDDKKEQYRIYRQKLRDLPAQFYDIINLEDVTFPEVDNV